MLKRELILMKTKRKNKQKQTTFSVGNKSKIYFLALILVPFILYFRAINFDFSNYDDTNIIIQNYNVLKNLENIPKTFTTDCFLTNKTSFYRPIQTLSFMIDAQISGTNPWGYHLTNIILHILSVIFLFLFLKLTDIKEDIAFLLSLLYAVHPMLTMAVCWIPARGDLLLTLFGLISFVTFINYFRTKKDKFLIFHFLSFLILCFSKETAVVFPLLFVLYYYLIIKQNTFQKKIIPFLIIWGSSFIVYFIFRTNVIKVSEPSSVAGILPLIKNLPAIPITFGKFFIPQGLTTMPLFNLFSIFIGILILILFVLLIIKIRAYNNSYLVLGAVWFFCFTIPPLIYRLGLADHHAEYFEHRTGLPLIGILIVVGVLINELLNKIAFKKILNVFLGVLIIFSILSWFHSYDYSDAKAFFSSAIKADSNNAVAFNLRGNIYFNEGNYEQSLKDIDNSIRACSYYSYPYFNKGSYYRSMGDHKQSEYYYSLALNYDTLYPILNPNYESVYIDLAVEKISLHKFDEALVVLKKAIAFDPRDCKIYNNLSVAYFYKGKFDSAISASSKAIELAPDSASYFNNRGLAKYSSTDYTGANNDFRKAEELNPNDPITYFYLGITALGMGDNNGAIANLTSAIKLNSNYSSAYYCRGVAYSKINKPTEAGEDWAVARKLGFNVPIAESQKEK